MILHGFLAAWLLLTAACVGGIAWQAIHRLTGGAWGDDLAGRWKRLRSLLPLAALAAVPLLLDAHHLFPWIDEPVEKARLWYFNYSFLVWRTVGCFLAWSLAWWLISRAAAASLIVWLFTCGVFATDWIVSLTPEWRSSVISLILAVGQLSMGLAVALLMPAPRGLPAAAERTRRDESSLLFATCLGWTYLVGIDYLTAWMADLPYETAWYLPRTVGLPAMLALAAIVAQGIVPFALLLTQRAKTMPGLVRAAAASVALGQACHMAWMVMP